MYQNSWLRKIRVTLCKASKINKNHLNLFTSNTIGKCLEIHCNKTDEARHLLKHINEASNVKELGI